MNVIRHLNERVEMYSQKIGKENILVYPVGRKVADAVKKLGITPMGDYQHMSGKPNYKEAAALAAELMDRFIHGEVQQVELLYNHFKSTSTQVLTQETFLPIDWVQSSDPKERMRKRYLKSFPTTSWSLRPTSWCVNCSRRCCT